MKTILPAAAFMVVVLMAPVLAEETGSKADSPTGSAATPLSVQLQDAAAQLDNGDAKSAQSRLHAIVSDPGFAALSPDDQLDAKADLGVADFQVGDYAAALRYMKEVCKSDRANAQAWLVRYFSDNRVRDFDDAAVSLIALAGRWPDALSQITDTSMGMAMGRKLDPERRTALLEALYAVDWKPQSPFDTPDGLYVKLVRIRLDKGDVAGAAEIAGRITSPGTLAGMKIDKRFDAVVKIDPAHYDIASASAHRIADLRAKLAASPNNLEGINTLADELIVSGHSADALPLLDDAMNRYNASGAKDAFSDPEQVNWTENHRAYALARVGRIDESLAQMASAAKETELGGANISQTINLAEAYDNAGRPHDALAAVASMDLSNISAYGRMQMQGVLACAYAQLHDDTNLKTSLDYLTSHAADAAEGAGPALICANDLDGAAKAYIADLDNPDTRNGTLFALQDFTVSHPRTGPEKEEYDRLVALKARPDVAAAIAKYGRIDQIPLDPLF